MLQYCDGTYLEDQDYWHLSGIHRDVRIYAKAKQRIYDYKIETIFEGDRYEKADLRVTLHPNNTVEGYGECYVILSLYDAKKELVTTFQSVPYAKCGFYLQPKFIAVPSINIDNPYLWSAEDPYLYTLVMESIDGTGNITDIESAKVDFRKMEIRKDGVLCINGKRLTIGSRGIEINKAVINNCVSKTIPRIGLSFVLPKDKNQITWYGRGPRENYSDRKEAAFMSCFSSTVSEYGTG